MIEEVLNLIEAAAFFKMSPEALRKKIHTDDIPAYKGGKGWTFLRSDLIEYMRSKYLVENNFYLTTKNQVTEESKAMTSKKNKKLSANSYSSQIKIEKEYQEALCPS